MSLTCFDTWTTHYHYQEDHSCWHSSPSAPVLESVHLPAPGNPEPHTTDMLHYDVITLNAKFGVTFCLGTSLSDKILTASSPEDRQLTA